MGHGTSGGQAPKLYARDFAKPNGKRHRSNTAKREKWSSNLSKQSQQRRKEYKAWQRQQRNQTNPATG